MENMDLSQKTAYLKGLAEGKGLTKDETKGDFVVAILDCLNSMAEEIESLEEYIHELTEYAEAIDEDLGDVEDLILDDEDDDCCCGDHDHICDDDEVFVETECPVCGEILGYCEGLYDEPTEIICPNCETVVAVIGEDDDEEIVVEEEDED